MINDVDGLISTLVHPNVKPSNFLETLKSLNLILWGNAKFCTVENCHVLKNICLRILNNSSYQRNFKRLSVSVLGSLVFKSGSIFSSKECQEIAYEILEVTEIHRNDRKILNTCLRSIHIVVREHRSLLDDEICCNLLIGLIMKSLALGNFDSGDTTEDDSSTTAISARLLFSKEDNILSHCALLLSTVASCKPMAIITSWQKIFNGPSGSLYYVLSDERRSFKDKGLVLEIIGSLFSSCCKYFLYSAQSQPSKIPYSSFSDRMSISLVEALNNITYLLEKFQDSMDLTPVLNCLSQIIRCTRFQNLKNGPELEALIFKQIEKRFQDSECNLILMLEIFENFLSAIPFIEPYLIYIELCISTIIIPSTDSSNEDATLKFLLFLCKLRQERLTKAIVSLDLNTWNLCSTSSSILLIEVLQEILSFGNTSFNKDILVFLYNNMFRRSDDLVVAKASLAVLSSSSVQDGLYLKAILSNVISFLNDISFRKKDKDAATLYFSVLSELFTKRIHLIQHEEFYDLGVLLNTIPEQNDEKLYAVKAIYCESISQSSLEQNNLEVLLLDFIKNALLQFEESEKHRHNLIRIISSFYLLPEESMKRNSELIKSCFIVLKSSLESSKYVKLQWNACRSAKNVFKNTSLQANPWMSIIISTIFTFCVKNSNNFKVIAQATLIFCEIDMKPWCTQEIYQNLKSYFSEESELPNVEFRKYEPDQVGKLITLKDNFSKIRMIFNQEPS